MKHLDWMTGAHFSLHKFVSGCEKEAHSKHSSVAFSPDRHITKMESTSLDREPEETPSSSSVKERWASSITIGSSQPGLWQQTQKIQPGFEVKWWRGSFWRHVRRLRGSLEGQKHRRFHRGLWRDGERGMESFSFHISAMDSSFGTERTWHTSLSGINIAAGGCQDEYAHVPPTFVLFLVLASDDQYSPAPRNYFCHDCMRWSNRRPAQRGWHANTADLQDFSRHKRWRPSIKLAQGFKGMNGDTVLHLIIRTVSFHFL